MYRLSDASGKMTFTTVSQGSLNKDNLDSKDVFLVDGGKHLFVWVGSGKFHKFSIENNKPWELSLATYALSTNL